MRVLRPAGPLPARVYWARRLAVLVAAVVALAAAVVVVQVVGGMVGSPRSAAASLSPSTNASAGGRVCPAGTLGLTLAADGASYPASAMPVFTVKVVSNGPAGCIVDAGEAQREIVITSGTDRIWSSRDCAAAAAMSRPLLMAPGVPDETQVQWQRTRSAAGCPANRPAALKGTYSATLTLPGASSPPVVFVLA